MSINILNDLHVYGNVSANGGNSIIWNSVYTDVATSSANWNIAYTNLNSNSAAYLSSPDLTLIQTNSAGWENTQTIVELNSASWAPQTLSFNTSGAILSISNGNSVSLSALSSTGGGGGGLTYLTERLYTASPNNSVNVVELAVTGGSTNTDLVLNPKGTGAFIAFRAPDGTATGGNKRGSYAVDLQGPWRTGGTEVASGASSVIMGGRYNRISGAGAYAAVAGYFSVASAQAAMALGYQMTASGFASFACGYLGTASGDYAFVGGGEGNTSSGTNASSFGRYALASRYAMQAICAGPFSTGTPGDAQHALFVMRNKTTTNTEVELFLDGSSTRLTVPSGRLMGMFINLMGVKSDGSVVAHYMRQYAIKNVAGTTSEVYAPVTIGVDTAAGTTIAITANDTNDALRIGVTGITSEIWRWVAVVQAVEIVHGT